MNQQRGQHMEGLDPESADRAQSEPAPAGTGGGPEPGRAGGGAAEADRQPTRAPEWSAGGPDQQTTGPSADGADAGAADPSPGRPAAQAFVEGRDGQPAATDGSADHDVAPNYRYWREHGEEWADEYDSRKRHQPYYHIQEVMLADYVAHHAPAKVLEFGCGVGRHLQNLSEIPGIEAYGYDQSQTMVNQCLRWASQAWIDECVIAGEPTGRLPYADGEFDIVFTAEVLLHIRPEDLDGILTELIRVCRGHILHLEPAETYELVFEEHDGCWKHDLVEAYDRLGRQCELLPSGFVAQRPFRVVVGEQPRYTWSALVLSLFRRMEQDMNRGGSELQHSRTARQQQTGESEQLWTLPEKTPERVTTVQERLLAAQRECANLRQRQAPLETRLAEALADAQRKEQLHDEVSAARSAAEQRCQELEHTVAQLRGLQRDMTERVGQLQESLLAAQQECAELRPRGAALETQAAEAVAARSAAEQRSRELERTVAELRSALERQARTLNEHVAEMAREREEQRKQVDHLLREQDLFLFRANQLLEG